jgi:hypothetical protein
VEHDAGVRLSPLVVVMNAVATILALAAFGFPLAAEADSSVSYPTIIPWFAGTGRFAGDNASSGIGANHDELQRFLALRKQRGIGVVSGGSNTLIWPATNDYKVILGAGYEQMGGLGGYAAACAQNDPDPNHCPVRPNGQVWLFSYIDAQATYLSPAQCQTAHRGIGLCSGSTWLYVDEPCLRDEDYTAGLSDNCSIPYNAAGMSIILNYIRNVKHYNIKVGYTEGAYVKLYQTWLDLFTYTKHNNLLIMDFAQEEEYDTWQDPNNTNPWAAFHAVFPNVLRSTLFYSVASFCSAHYANFTDNTIDMIGFWNVDNWGISSGPMIDPNQLAAAEDLGATGSKSATCSQTWSEITNADWTTRRRGDHSFNVSDGPYPGWTSPYLVGSCDYQVWSGLGGANGPTDPSMVQTWPSTAGQWASRSCNVPILITVGPGKNCRDEISEPIFASIAGTTLKVTGGTFTAALLANPQRGAAIFGPGVAPGTHVTESGTGRGGTGTYSVNVSQTVASESMQAKLGNNTCLVVVRNHNSSPRGLGGQTYTELSVAF